MNRSALIQVLGAVAYGEQKAYDGAKARSEEAGNEEERRIWRTIAAEELRHHKGFVRRLVAQGADPDRAMAPYRSSLDRYHGKPAADGVAGTVQSYLGEGIAADMLRWLREVADSETAAFIDTVLDDELGHEAHALADLRDQMAASSNGRAEASAGARQMLLHMAGSGSGTLPAFGAFLALGRPIDLLANLVGGYVRRLASLGLLNPVHSIPDPLGLFARAS